MIDKLNNGIKAVLPFGVMLALCSAMIFAGAHPILAQEKAPIKIGFSISLTGGLSAGG